MKKYLLVENKGEVDVIAFYMMGITSKDGEEKIGRFGTGFKYGLASILRAGHEIVVFSGLKKYTFKMLPVTFRDKTFNHIVIKAGNKIHETSITAEMGTLEWTLDKGLVEIFSNAMDEGGFGWGYPVTQPNGHEGFTRIFISAGDDIKLFVDNIDKFFTFTRTPVYADDRIAVYKKAGSLARMFRKGVCVHTGVTKSVYDYDIDDIPIGENRMASAWDAKHRLAKYLDRLPMCVKEDIVNEISKDHSFFEAGLDMDYVQMMSDDWPKIFDGKIVVFPDEYRIFHDRLMSYDVVVLPDGWKRFIQGGVGIKTIEAVLKNATLKGWEESKISTFHQAMVDEAVMILRESGYDIDINKIVLAKNEKAEAPLGQFVENKYYINIKCFEQGIDFVINAILEEHLHDTTGQFDETRAFQNTLFQQLVYNIKKVYYLQKVIDKEVKNKI